MGQRRVGCAGLTQKDQRRDGLAKRQGPERLGVSQHRQQQRKRKTEVDGREAQRQAALTQRDEELEGVKQKAKGAINERESDLETVKEKAKEALATTGKYDLLWSCKDLL